MFLSGVEEIRLESLFIVDFWRVDLLSLYWQIIAFYALFSWQSLITMCFSFWTSISLNLGLKKESTFSIISFLLLLSLVRASPVEKCVSELKTPNIPPGEREVIKGQARTTWMFCRVFFFFLFPLILLLSLWLARKNRIKKKAGWHSREMTSVDARLTEAVPRISVSAVSSVGAEWEVAWLSVEDLEIIFVVTPW